MRVCQRALDQSSPGIRPGVGDEGVDGFWCGRQSEQIEVKSSDECPGIGLWREVESGVGQSSADEGIDRVVATGESGRVVVIELLERPVRRLAGGLGCGLGEPGPLVDPGSQQSQLFCVESGSFGRHPDVGIDACGIEQQRAVGSVARPDRLLFSVASGNRHPSPIESIIAFLSFGSVACEAVSSEDRADVLIEVDVSFGGCGQSWRRGLAAGMGQGEDQDAK
jgi:hypothetical protein